MPDVIKETVSCPYCEIKEDAGKRITYKAINLKYGHCDNCGAWLDRGQVSVRVNGYSDIYKGALRLIGSVVEQFSDLLAATGVDIDEMKKTLGAEDEPYIYLTASEITKQLFLPYAGGTTVGNFTNAIGVEHESYRFMIGNTEDED